jgi:hypothetical protein
MKRTVPRQAAQRQLFVLTSEEKRTIGFVLMMLLLGVTTAHFRAAHFVWPATTAVQEAAKSAGLPAQKRAESKHRSLAR